MTLAAEYLREILSYDPDTGVFRWKVSETNRVSVGGVAGSQNGDGYTRIMIGKKKYRAHRLAWLHVYGEWPAKYVDHVDGDRSNNKITNLREATNAQNMRNCGAYATNTSGFKGVTFHKHRRRWHARINIPSKQIHLGYFDTPEEAHAAYCAAAAKLHGEFARTK
jgi:hypothetical protein